MDDQLREQFAEAAANGDFVLARKLGAKWALNSDDDRDTAQRAKAYLDILKAAGMKIPSEEPVVLVQNAPNEKPQPQKSLLQTFLERKKLTREQLLMSEPSQIETPPEPQPEVVYSPPEEFISSKEVGDEPVKPKHQFHDPDPLTPQEEAQRKKYFERRREGYNHKSSAVSCRGNRHLTRRWEKEWDAYVAHGLEQVKK